MSIVLAVLAALAFSIQSTLMARFYRSIDQLSVLSYRGVCLAVSMVSLVPLAGEITSERVVEAFPYGLAAGVFGLCGAFFGATSYRFLPLGVAGSIAQAVAGLGAVFFAWLWLGEALTPFECSVVAVLLTAAAALGLARNAHPIEGASLMKGIPCAVAFGVGLCFAYSSAGIGSRISSPILVGYIWEASIAMTGFVAIGIRRFVFRGRGLERIPWGKMRQIFLCSLPTVVASACYTFALHLGPVGIVTALLSMTAVFSTVFARLLYRERVSYFQGALILLICLCAALLKLHT